jgi:hypothetical protein
VAKRTIIKQEIKWQHVIDEPLLRLSVSLKSLSQNRVIKITKTHSIAYKTQPTTTETQDAVLTPATRHSSTPRSHNQTPGITLAPATRHSLASNPNKQNPGIVPTSATQRRFQPLDFQQILAIIPADSK